MWCNTNWTGQSKCGWLMTDWLTKWHSPTRSLTRSLIRYRHCQADRLEWVSFVIIFFQWLCSSALVVTIWPALLVLYLQSWDVFFRNATQGAPPGVAYSAPPSISTSVNKLAGMVQSTAVGFPGVVDTKLIDDHLAVQAIIRSYQVRRRLRCQSDDYVQFLGSEVFRSCDVSLFTVVWGLWLHIGIELYLV